MTQAATTDRFVAEYHHEPAAIQAARQAAQEWGIDSVSPAVGAQLALLAAAADAKAIAEVGTGAGVSGLWLLTGAPEATLTTIESEVDYQQAAKRAFTAAGIPSSHTRTILGRAAGVLDRLADAAYDLVFIDADIASAAEYVAQGLRIARPGGLIVLAHALDHSRVADPTQRADETVALRTLLAEIGQREHVRSTLSRIGDGLLTLVAPRD
ncbi:O-methyltransferase [Pseudoclavibacter soli]|uniref:O-methyltransferase n=1 Tax=Pseudoclavibacter soli TaxID=452623 RepID=UPI00041B7D9C|nr:class I SAM-dependent methyltransferase [Pseudoclavibacter soli]